MPSWGQVLTDIELTRNPLDSMRRKYLRTMYKYTKRNIIAYYSAFIQKPNINGCGIDENDKNAFMQAVYGLDKSKGLDLILHTPGGGIAPTESLVIYLQKMFGKDIRVFVPQIAMSAGTMIALSAKEIVLGKQSNLGPIDPQYGGMSCAGILEEFQQARKEVKGNPSSAAIWGLIISKYHPTFIGDCKKAIEWSEEMVKTWLINNMFSEYNEEEGNKLAQKVVTELSSHNKTYSHSRHIHSDLLKKLNLKIVDLEELDDKKIDGCKDLQDCVLTLHHSYMHTLAKTATIKIVENHKGEAMIIAGKGTGK